MKLKIFTLRNIQKNKLMSNSVSICLPIFNEEKSIKKVIEEWVSCLEDLSINYEIICSEDGSTDKTPEILENYV